MIEWPSTASARDAVIVPEQTSSGLRFVVYGRLGPQLECRTYAEAEARALSYAEHASGCVWYAGELGFQLVGSFVRLPMSPPPTTTKQD